VTYKSNIFSQPIFLPEVETSQFFGNKNEPTFMRWHYSCLSFVFLVYAVFCYLEFGYHYECKFPGKTHL